ncbi:sugar transferase [Sphingomonas spermidinifaciens]|uniref:Sugar transferase n=1 Tax=Sphingomonas spermidinifaciens TaxID=1141889 RepID=A0A2A4B2I7_9SPHN|nr:sugar transferase [Sphingomonas spermidinifaciens]
MLLIVIDLFSLTTGFTLANVVRDQQWLSPGGVDLLMATVPVYFMFALGSDAYSRPAVTSGRRTISLSLWPLMITALAILTTLFLFRVSAEVSRLAFVFSIGTSAALMIALRYGVVRVVRDTVANSLVSELLIIDNADWSWPIEGDVIYADRIGLNPDVSDPYMLHRFAELCDKYERIVVRCSADRQADWALVLRGANVIGEIIIAGFGSIPVLGLKQFRDRPSLLVARGPLSYSDMAKKRALDLALTIPIVIAVAPLLAIIAIAIKLDSPGTVLFKQERIGRGNRIFHILKFRSMRADLSDGRGATSTRRDDDRITRVGRFIRRTSLDELPQLFNVLLGQMSLVGPRPHALGSLAGDRLFWEIDREYWYRHALKPGITGLAQVRGFRGATHRPEDLKNRLQADIEYLNGWSLTRDIAILFATLNVLVHRNAY